MQGLRFQKLGIINIVSHGIADDNHNGRGTPDYEKQEAMK